MNQTLNLSPISNNNIVVEPRPQSILDLSLYDENYPSIYIPYINDSITEENMKEFINNLNIGNVLKLDFITIMKKTGSCYKKVIIYFTKWNWNKNACHIREKLITNRDYKYKDENFRFKFKLNFKSTVPRLPSISHVVQIDKKNTEFYNDYCNHYKKRRIFMFDENK
jgi:hypothetical protein